jgi:demethylmenaquinone methyltransferase / 2-methoxy-6-polyprenyl-1,4-benzoquinol methylase
LPIEADRHQKRVIRELFTRIAARYDRINRLLSLGQDQGWRLAALQSARIVAPGRLLDVATGTGDMGLLALEHAPGAHVVGVDLTPAMLYEARSKALARSVTFPLTAGDGFALPFADDSFDAVTSAFMMRNVPREGFVRNIEEAFREQARVVRPGGRVVCLEMTWPRRFPMRWLFGFYFYIVPPIVGLLAIGEQQAYRYLPRSVRSFLDPVSLAQTMVRAGLCDVAWRSLMLGTVVIHVGTKDLSFHGGSSDRIR